MPRTRAQFIFNRAILTELKKDPAVQAQLLQFAELAAEAARSIAPVGEVVHEGDTPGQYRDSIHAEVSIEEGGAVLGARVIADDYKSAWIEFGTGGGSPTEPFAVLRRAIELELGGLARLVVRRTRTR